MRAGRFFYQLKVPLWIFAFIFVTDIYVHSENANGCDLIVGKWTWFTGGVVTFRADGTLTHDPGNDGTWQCLDASKAEVLIKWRVGGYVNKVELSLDNEHLSSTDPTQSFVHGERIGPTPAAKPDSPPGPSNATTDTPKSTSTPAVLTDQIPPQYQISPEDSQALARLMKRMNGDYTYTKQTHWPDGSVNDDGYLIATMSLTLNDLTLEQRYLKCKVSNPGWRTDGYVISANTGSDCDKNLHGLKWAETMEHAPTAQIDPSSIQIQEIDKNGSTANLALSFGYTGYDPEKWIEEDENEDDPEAETVATIHLPPGFTILRCRNRGTCGEMAADLKSIIEISRKYATPATSTQP